MSAHDVSESVSMPSATPARVPALADPVPLGIAGFAMTTFALSCANAGFFGGTASTPMVLGLAICRAIIGLHAGRIWAEELQPHGAAIHFTLPSSVAGPAD